MNNAARPKVRAQIHPRALEIVEYVFKIPEGYDDYGTPHYRGVPSHAWTKLQREHTRAFQELLGILHTDYPTFAALIQKIWAKKVGHILPFIFNRVQLLAWGRVAYRLNNKLPLFFVILKARQLGMSTLINGFIHWQVWRVRDIECLMVTHDKPLAESFIDRMRIFHAEMPQISGVTRTLRQNTKQARVPKDELYYNETRSKASTVVAKNMEARGRSTLHNHLAEYAFYPEASKNLGALMPQLPSVGSPARLQCSVWVESTPNGKNDFYQLWDSAQEEGSEWEGEFFPWMVAEDEYYLEPPNGWKSERDPEWVAGLAHIREGIDGCNYISDGQLFWYEQTFLTEQEGDQDKMDSEYPSDDETCFLLRSRSIFRNDMRYLSACVTAAERRAPEMFHKRDIKCLRSYLRGRMEYTAPPNPFGDKPPSIEQLRLRPKFIEDPDGPLVLWEPPLPTHAYVCGIDSASGLMDSDNSVNCILDATAGRQIGEYAARVGPEKLADDSCAIGWFYNVALLYPEINSIGVVTMKRLKQLWCYPKVGLEEKWDEVALKSGKYGNYTTNIKKEIMVSFLKYLVSERFIAIASAPLLAEMSTFIQTVTPEGLDKFGADNNSHDDRVLGLLLAAFAVKQSPKLLISMTKEKNRNRVPTAIQAGIHDAPTPAGDHRLSELAPEVRKILTKGTEVLCAPANPIRGSTEILF